MSITLGAIGAIGVFLNSPGMLRLPSAIIAPSATEIGGHYFVSWLIFSTAANYPLAKLGSLIAHRHPFSALLYSLVLGLIAVAISAYLAADYLNPAEITWSTSSEGIFHNWHGINLAAYGFFITTLWIIIMLATFGPAIARYFAELDTDSPDNEVMLFFLFAVVLVVSFIGYWFTSHALLVGMIPSVEFVPTQ